MHSSLSNLTVLVLLLMEVLVTYSLVCHSNQTYGILSPMIYFITLALV